MLSRTSTKCFCFQKIFLTGRNNLYIFVQPVVHYDLGMKKGEKVVHYADNQ